MAETFSFVPFSKQPIADGFEVVGVLVGSVTPKTQRTFRAKNNAELVRLATDAARTRPQEEATKDDIVLNVALDVTPPADQPPHVETPEEKALRLWREADAPYQAALRKVTSGYVAAEDPAVVALRDAAVALYKPEYLTVG